MDGRLQPSRARSRCAIPHPGAVKELSGLPGTTGFVAKDGAENGEGDVRFGKECRRCSWEIDVEPDASPAFAGFYPGRVQEREGRPGTSFRAKMSKRQALFPSLF